MPQTVSLTHLYDHPAALVWQVVTDLDCLKQVTSSLLTYRSLPSGQIYEGQELLVDVSLFGKLPYQPYLMKVVSFEPERFYFQSSESGAGVKSWKHKLQVTAINGHSRIDERIEIDAGLKTPLFKAWARFMYQRRHQPRLDILKSLSPEKAIKL